MISNPLARAWRSVSPVRPTQKSNTLHTALPRIPGYVSSPPQMLTAATRPCLLAVEPSGTYAGSPVTRSTFSAQSPTAKMRGSDVRRWSSTLIAPVRPISRPACFASATLGRTPIPMITISTGRTPWLVTTRLTWLPSPSNAVAVVFVMTLTPRASMCCSTSLAMSQSSIPRIWSASSTIVTRHPFSTRASVTSTPIRPPPMTTTSRARSWLNKWRMPSASFTPCSVNTCSRSMPGMGGLTGVAPVASTR